MNNDIFRIVNGEVIISGQICSRNEGEQIKQEISFYKNEFNSIHEYNHIFMIYRRYETYSYINLWQS